MQPASPALKVVEAVAEAIAVQLLEAYTAALSSAHSVPTRRKEVTDPLWGTVSLSTVELAVLDSPLLQRLRFMRQLGAAHWVYPGAVHTRFEHAIGALYQTQQLIESINSVARQQGEESLPISADEAQLLRLASLFSHVGHLAFSECSVSELEAMPSFASVARDFADESVWTKEGEDPPLCRVLAFFIVRSPTSRKFMRAVVDACDWTLHKKNAVKTVDAAIETISWAIVGRRIDADQCRPQLHELTTGPFDGGILDELVRNAKFSGIPSVLDVRRLILKLAVRRQAAGELPYWISQGLDVSEKPLIWIFGMRASSAPVLNELQLAQVLVSAKVRRHPKVLAVEEMLRSVVRIAGELATPDKLLMFLYTCSEDSLIGFDGDSLKRALQPKKTRLINVGRKIAAAAAVLASIRERRVWVRALQLTDVAQQQDHKVAVALDRLRADMGHLQRSVRLADRLCKEVAKVREEAGEPAIADSDLAAQIKMRTLQPMSAESRVGRAVILQEGQQPRQLSTFWSPMDNWVDQYLRGQTTAAYIFSTPELADSVYVAIERIASRDYGAQFPRGTREASRRDKDSVTALRNAMPQESWHGIAWSSRTHPRILDAPHTQRRIAALEKKLATVRTTSAVERASVHEWLLQFETNLHIRCALSVLEGLKIVDRVDTEKSVGAFFDAHPEFQGAYVIPFGDLKDGSALQGYFSNAQKYVDQVVSVEQWIQKKDDRPVVFVDDFVGSGGQACDILAAWFDRKELRRDLKEQRNTQPLEVREKLQRTQLAFLFVAGWDDGLESIDEIAPKLQLRALTFAHIRDPALPYMEAHLRAVGFSHSEIESFRARCEKIGEELLHSSGTEEGKILERRLGYGNRGMLLSTLVNVPTQTMTAIWRAGVVDGVNWKPLLPRKTKK